MLALRTTQRLAHITYRTQKSVLLNRANANTIWRASELVPIRAISLKSIFSPSTKSKPTKHTCQDKGKNANGIYPLSRSPSKEIREKGALIRVHGTCPICADQAAAGSTLAVRHPEFECPECGYPTHCSEEHWKQDQAHHDEACKHLRMANEDEHDLRSGRRMTEFEFPSAQLPEMVINMSSWDTFFYTRQFRTVGSAQAMRHVSKLLTYPITVGAALHPLSPFTLKSGLTSEGLKSVSALRATMKEHEMAQSDKQLAVHMRPLRVFILGARAEAMLPPHIYLQLSYLFPHSPLHIHFIGPECIPSPDQNNVTVSVTSRLVLKFYKDLFHDAIWNFTPFDPYTDVFFMFSPGLGHPLGRPVWQPTIDKLLETKCAVYATGFHDRDLQSDIDTLTQDFGPSMDWLLEPQQNPFRSLKRDFGIRDLREWAVANWGIYAFRGKRYEVQSKA